MVTVKYRRVKMERKRLVYETATLYYHRRDTPICLRWEFARPEIHAPSRKLLRRTVIAIAYSQLEYLYALVRVHVCPRKTRALLGSPYNVSSRYGTAHRRRRFQSGRTDLPAETNFAGPLEVFIKTTV